MKLNGKATLFTLAVVFGMLLTVFSCKKIKIRELTTEDVNIMGYLRNHPDQFSELTKVLDRTDISSFLNTYGTYTLFAPTNDAIKLYLQQVGKQSTDQIDNNTWINLIKFHIIQDTTTTTSFKDGKLTTPTMYGQFLITGVNETGGTVVNRQGLVLQSNILTGNGYVHVIDHVLQPAQLTIAKLIEQDPKFSIFTQAMKATGFYTLFNTENNPDTTKRWLTVLAESDSVLRLNGINSYSDLVKRYNNTSDPTNPADSLNLFVAYHTLYGVKFVGDIVALPSHQTLAPESVITTTLRNDSLLLNEVTFNNVTEPGVPIERKSSDYAATNGVVHSVQSNIILKIRLPYRVDFDLAAQPEMVKLTSIYGKPGKSVTFSYGQLQDVTWQNQNLAAAQYSCLSSTSTDYYWKNDAFNTHLRTPSGTNNWIEFVTPLIVKGRYKIWINYRRTSGLGKYTQVSFDGEPTSRIVDFTVGLPSSTASDAVLESQGFKKYAYNAPSNTSNVGQTAGVIDVKTTDRHRIRLTAIRDNGNGTNLTLTLDFIQFIPINDVQWRPLYAKDGSVIP